MTFEGFLRRVVAIVDDLGVSYMLTGSLASAYHGEPRATRDIDVVVALDNDEVRRLVRRLEEEGFYVSGQAAREAVRRRTQFNAVDPGSGWKVDWIIRRDRPFSRVEFERRKRVEVMGLDVPMVTPEDLIVAKLEWAERGGSDVHVRDALAILVQGGRELDRAHLERWIGALGLEDRWNDLLESAESERKS